MEKREHKQITFKDLNPNDFPSKWEIANEKKKAERAADFKKRKEEYLNSLNENQKKCYKKAIYLLENTREKYSKQLRYDLTSATWKIQQLYLKNMTPDKNGEELEEAGTLLLDISNLAKICKAKLEIIQPSEKW